MQEFFTIISNFGFPVAVASYLLFRYEKILLALKDTNAELVTKDATLIEKHDELIKVNKELKAEIIKLRSVIEKRGKLQ
jgi:hypothetical protein